MFFAGLALLCQGTASIQFRFRKGSTGLTMCTATRHRRGFTLVQLQKNSEIPGGRNFADIVNGLSNVIMIAESSYVNTSKTAATTINDWPTWIGGLGEDEQIRTNGRTTAPVNCGCKRNNWMTWLSDDCAFSTHPGGAMFLLCDGSVHFILENINIHTYCNMNSVGDGNPLGNWK